MLMDKFFKYMETLFSVQYIDVRKNENCEELALGELN